MYSNSKNHTFSAKIKRETPFIIPSIYAYYNKGHLYGLKKFLWSTIIIIIRRRHLIFDRSRKVLMHLHKNGFLVFHSPYLLSNRLNTSDLDEWKRNIWVCDWYNKYIKYWWNKIWTWTIKEVRFLWGPSSNFKYISSHLDA